MKAVVGAVSDEIPRRLFYGPRDLWRARGVSRVFYYAQNEGEILELLRAEHRADELFLLQRIRMAAMQFFKGPRPPFYLERFGEREAVSGYEVVLADFLHQAEREAGYGWETGNLDALQAMVAADGLPWMGLGN